MERALKVTGGRWGQIRIADEIKYTLFRENHKRLNKKHLNTCSVRVDNTRILKRRTFKKINLKNENIPVSGFNKAFGLILRCETFFFPFGPVLLMKLQSVIEIIIRIKIITNVIFADPLQSNMKVGSITINWRDEFLKSNDPQIRQLAARYLKMDEFPSHLG